MKKTVLLVCAIIGLFGIISKPVIVNAAEHETGSVSYTYLFGSMTSYFEWDFIRNERIVFSSGRAHASGLAISGEVFQTSMSDSTHIYKTIVERCIDVGFSYYGSAGGGITWTTDSYYTALTYDGWYGVSHDGTFE